MQTKIKIKAFVLQWNANPNDLFCWNVCETFAKNLCLLMQLSWTVANLINILNLTI